MPGTAKAQAAAVELAQARERLEMAQVVQDASRQVVIGDLRRLANVYEAEDESQTAATLRLAALLIEA